MMRAMRAGKHVVSRNKREETGFSIGNSPGEIIVETKVVVMFECFDGHLQSFHLFKLKCDRRINRELES